MEFSDKIQKEHKMKTKNRMAEIAKGVFGTGITLFSLALSGNYCYNNMNSEFKTKSGCYGTIQKFPNYSIVVDLENRVTGLDKGNDGIFDEVRFEDTGEDITLTDFYIPIPNAERLQPAVERLEDIQKCIEGK